MKIFFDTEFMECGETQTVKLLSAGFVALSGDALYIVITDAPRNEANDFVKKNVLPYLDTPPFTVYSDALLEDSTHDRHIDGKIEYVRCPRSEAGQHILNWVNSLSSYETTTVKPEFWAWHGAYDWVVLCQLFGDMVDLPKHWPMFVRDLRQETSLPNRTPAPDLPKGLPQHHALADACQLRWDYQTRNSKA